MDANEDAGGHRWHLGAFDETHPLVFGLLVHQPRGFNGVGTTCLKHQQYQGCGWGSEYDFGSNKNGSDNFFLLV